VWKSVEWGRKFPLNVHGILDPKHIFLKEINTTLLSPYLLISMYVTIPQFNLLA